MGLVVNLLGKWVQFRSSQMEEHFLFRNSVSVISAGQFKTFLRLISSGGHE